MSSCSSDVGRSKVDAKVVIPDAIIVLPPDSGGPGPIIKPSDGGLDTAEPVVDAPITIVDTAPVNPCGNALVDDGVGETCDDGNARGGDGCDGTCQRENGWVCPVPGQPCVLELFCGDGKPGPDESCDDGNSKSGDGCSSTCTIEDHWKCPVFGSPCEPTVLPPVCNNGEIEAGESCDDGNILPGDGCSATCQKEQGWTCVGAPSKCTRDPTCGNGVVDQGEQCDDGNRIPGDCCGATCKIESNCKCTSSADAGTDAGASICSSTIVCGDGVVSGGEACDDGNMKDKDGCAADCTKIEGGFVCPPTGGPCKPAEVLCPNAKINPGEECDDGNAQSTDGCSANCKIELGYICPTPGVPCKLKEFCGDGKVSYILGETCDDGNTDFNDGCSATCKIEPKFNCDNTASPSRCTLEKCGNGTIGSGETCDDGNAASNDGCSSTCQLEPDFVCPAPGRACRPICGNGVRQAGEQCDDSNTSANDGCSPLCQIEPGYFCDGTGCHLAVCGNGDKEGSEPCDDTNTSTGAVDMPFDGCYKCMKEPDCSAGACKSACGDGQRFADEECDDGNTFDGDGCSSTCKKETGYSCTDDSAGALPSTKTLPIVVRDFIGLGREINPSSSNTNYHPDFNRHNGSGIFKMVKTTLGADGKPQWRWLPFNTSDLGQSSPTPLANCTCDETAASWSSSNETWSGGNEGAPVTLTLSRPPCSCGTCTCDNTGHLYQEGGRRNFSTPENFAQWYTNTSNINLQVPYLLSLNLTDQATGRYTNDLNSSSFDPLVNGGWIAAGKETVSGCGNGNTVNVSFTTETRFWFEYNGGEEFIFSGDDDTWVFVNGILAVDLGGLHGREEGSFTLHASNGTAVSRNRGQYYDGTNFTSSQGANVNLGLELGKVYQVVMFQAERNQCGSNFGVTLKNFSKPKSTCHAVCGDGIVAATEACDCGTDAANLPAGCLAPNNNASYGGCTASCTLGPYCGDKSKNGTEQCDDGLNRNAYGPESNGCGIGCKTAPFCGDGTTDAGFGETCDQGANNSATAYGPGKCNDKCQTAGFCGDGFTNGTEACDDGQNNGAPTSKCDSKCRIKCGNGDIDSGEQCDKGTVNGVSQNNGAYGGCKADCTLAPYCGDGFKQAALGEECDDGKNDGSYGTCTKACKLAAYCGDGKKDVEAGEVCDNGAANQLNPYGVSLCTTMCRPAPFCGDRSVDTSFGEKCDDGADNSDSKPGACRVDCSGYNPPPVTCGNGTIEAGEACDDEDRNGTAASLCDGRCQLKCGNGIKDAGEQCDDGTNDGSYGKCKPDCTLAPYCGDGNKDLNEQCDLGSAVNSADAYGPGKCTNLCATAPYCGDGRVNGPEKCDGQVYCTAVCTLAGPIP